MASTMPRVLSSRDGEWLNHLDLKSHGSNDSNAKGTRHKLDPFVGHRHTQRKGARTWTSIWRAPHIQPLQSGRHPNNDDNDDDNDDDADDDDDDDDDGAPMWRGCPAYSHRITCKPFQPYSTAGASSQMESA